MVIAPALVNPATALAPVSVAARPNITAKPGTIAIAITEAARAVDFGNGGSLRHLDTIGTP